MTVLITAHNGQTGQLGPLSTKTLLAHFLFPHTTLRPASKRRQGFEASSVNVLPYLVFHSPSIFFLCFSFHRKNTKARLFPGGADLGFFFLFFPSKVPIPQRRWKWRSQPKHLISWERGSQAKTSAPKTVLLSSSPLAFSLCTSLACEKSQVRSNPMRL